MPSVGALVLSNQTCRNAYDGLSGCSKFLKLPMHWKENCEVFIGQYRAVILAQIQPDFEKVGKFKYLHHKIGINIIILIGEK